VFDWRCRAHLGRRRPRLLEHVDAILATVAFPYHHEHDPTGRRERFYARHLLLPDRWLRVIVDFDRSPGRIVTAFIQERDPRRGMR
jgi:hypothetical protein